MGVFDWLGKRRRGGPEPAVAQVAWHVYREAGDIVVDDSRGPAVRLPLSGARSVRVVPLTGGNHHGNARAGWQVALSHGQGDALVGRPLADWRSARRLAQLVCETSDLPLDELTQKMFSRIGQYTPSREA